MAERRVARFLAVMVGACMLAGPAAAAGIGGGPAAGLADVASAGFADGPAVGFADVAAAGFADGLVVGFADVAAAGLASGAGAGHRDGLAAGPGRDSTLAAREDPERAQVLARVGGRGITVARFKHSYVRVLLRTGRNDTPETRRAHLDNLIATYLLAEEARRRGMEQEAEFAEYADRQLRLAVGGRYFEIVFADSLPPVTEAEVRRAYIQSKEQVSLRQLYFRDPAHAQAAHDRLVAGEDFVALAHEVFDAAPGDSLAGYLGHVSYHDLDDAVAEAVAELRVGAISEPVRSRYGWHILRVEDRLSSPILSESDYQYRRQGIEGRARIRRNRAAGDVFVRRLMEGLDVEVDPAGARLAADAIASVVRPRSDEPPPPRLSDEEMVSIRDVLTPETVLLTYTLDGRRHVFTGLDFFRWLPDMRVAELRDRPLAAVGRALRNEVLALKGLAMGLDQDEVVQETFFFTTSAFLAGRLRKSMGQEEPAAVTNEDVRNAFQRMGYRSLREARATYWFVRFPSLLEAEAGRAAIAGGERAPSSFESYERREEADLKDDVVGGYARRAPEGSPVVACMDEEACYVLEVEDRTLQYTSLEEAEDEIRDRLGHLLPEAELLRRLHGEVGVDTDPELFDEIINAR